MQTANLSQVIYYSLAGGVLSLLVGSILISRKDMSELLVKLATPFAAGALIAAVFLDLIPDGVDKSKLSTVLNGALFGILVFFFLERASQWFHHHHEHFQLKRKKGKNLNLIIFGNGLHNVLDGVAIAASFLINVETGIITTMAVAAHEIPHEISDFGLMLKRGMSRKNVIYVNAVIALGTTLVAAITFKLGNNSHFPAGFLLGLSAGFLLYIAMSDIIPTIHEDLGHKKRLLDWQTILLLIGVLAVAGAVHIAKNFEAKNVVVPTRYSQDYCNKVLSGEIEDLNAVLACDNEL